jgi:hypothetical protein
LVVAKASSSGKKKKEGGQISSSKKERQHKRSRYGNKTEGFHLSMKKNLFCTLFKNTVKTSLSLSYRSLACSLA